MVAGDNRGGENRYMSNLLTNLWGDHVHANMLAWQTATMPCSVLVLPADQLPRSILIFMKRFCCLVLKCVCFLRLGTSRASTIGN